MPRPPSALPQSSPLAAKHAESLLYRAYIHRAGRQCIALTKQKACRASLLWAKRRRGGAVWSNLSSTKAVESKTKLKINHLRLSPGPEPTELAGFYVDAVRWPMPGATKA